MQLLPVASDGLVAEDDCALADASCAEEEGTGAMLNKSAGLALAAKELRSKLGALKVEKGILSRGRGDGNGIASNESSSVLAIREKACCA